MVFTEQTIRMFERANDIQQLWEPKEGDLAWHPNEGNEYMGSWEFPAEVVVVKVTELQSVEWWFNWYWLPRQDQLQEMIEAESLFVLLHKFRMFVSHDDVLIDGWSPVMYQFNSMEQLWLAFVMKEKYNKVWNEENWISEVRSESWY